MRTRQRPCDWSFIGGLIWFAFTLVGRFVPVRDLLFCAKHLFAAAINVVIAGQFRRAGKLQQRSAFRPPAATASRSVQNQRSPLLSLIWVLS